MGPKTSSALYAQSSSGLQIDHNRFDEPGMINGGSLVAIAFAGASNSAFKFNDVSATGTGLASAYLMSLTNGTGNLVIKDDVFVELFRRHGDRLLGDGRGGRDHRRHLIGL